MNDQASSIISELLINKSDNIAIDNVLRVLRDHMGMDIAFVSQITAGNRLFRYVDSAEGDTRIRVGDSGPIDSGYCQRVLDGTLPQLIPDTAACPAAMSLPVTHTMPIGAHLSVPLQLRDGSVYGTLCCFSYAANPTLNKRDIHTISAFADLISREIERELASKALHNARVALISGVVERGQLSIAYQPIVTLANKKVVGYECLSRFNTEQQRSPDFWFSEATQIGMGVELELAAVGISLQGIDLIHDEAYLSLNVSPETILSGRLPEILDKVNGEKIVLEVTEHAKIDDYEHLKAALAPLRSTGTKISIDDTGAGFASLRHILNLEPDFIKLDISLTRNIDTDRNRRALAAALVTFAEVAGGTIIAEGIETAPEMDTLQQLGIKYGQGYFLGRPAMLRKESHG